MNIFRVYIYFKVSFLIIFNICCVFSIKSNASALISDQSISESLLQSVNTIKTPDFLELSSEEDVINKNDTISGTDSMESIGRITVPSTTETSKTEIKDKYVENIRTEERNGFKSTESVYKSISETKNENITDNGFRDYTENSSQILSTDNQDLKNTTANTVIENAVNVSLASIHFDSTEKTKTSEPEVIDSTELDKNYNKSLETQYSANMTRTNQSSAEDLGAPVADGNSSEESVEPLTDSDSKISETNISETSPQSYTKNSYETTVSTIGLILSESIDHSLITSTINGQTLSPISSTINSNERDFENMTQSISLTSIATNIEQNNSQTKPKVSYQEETDTKADITGLKNLLTSTPEPISKTFDDFTTVSQNNSERTEETVLETRNQTINEKTSDSIGMSLSANKDSNRERVSETSEPTITRPQTFATVLVSDEITETSGEVNHNIVTNISTIERASDSADSVSPTTFIELIDQSMQTSNQNKAINWTEVSENRTTSNDTNHSSDSKDPIALSPFKVMCTVGGWAAYRRGMGRFDVSDLERADFVLSKCSHIIYSFVSFDSNGRVISFDSVKELDPKYGTFAKLRHIKQRYPHIKTLIAVGGWDTPADLFSFLVSTATRRQALAQELNDFVRLYSFDGLLISWFYPGVRAKGGHMNDKTNLVSFLQDLKPKLKSNDLELAIMGPALEEDIDSGFDVPSVSNLVDHLLLMTYDYFGSWDPTTNHLSPLYASSDHSSKSNVNYTLNYWLSKGADRQKTILGLATYGRSFTLSDPKSNQMNAPSIGPGIAGPYTNRPGIIGFNEICEIYLTTSGVKLEEDDYKVCPFIHLYDQWIGFEDEMSLFVKTTYAMDNELNGVFLWTLDLDDFHNKCNWGHFPLLKAIFQAIYKNKDIQ